jgi:Tol biopolymer transport system component
MKQAETFWQTTVLVLVFLMTVGVYAVLGWLWSRLQTTGQPANSQVTYQVPTPTPLPRSEYAVQIIEPLDGTILQRTSTIAVRSAIMEASYKQVEFLVDERRVAIEVKEDLEETPWLVQWAWENPTEGSHVLEVRAKGSRGRVEASLPVVVSVVPEGNLVFASNRSGAYAVYGIQTDGSDLIRITSGPGSARQPALRSDGVLAYVTESNSGRSVIRTLGEGEDEDRTLIAGLEPAWAPDGTWLAYSANSEGVSQVYTAPLDGGAPRQVTAEDAYAGQPSWSPDGTVLAYVVEQAGNWDIWIADTQGGEARRLTDDPAWDWSPSWSPDGTKLAFVSNRGGSHQIYVMDSDGTGLRRLTDLTAGAEAPAWSPDGFWLAFVAYTGEGTGINAREIHLVRSDGQHQVRLTQNAYDDTEVDWQWVP